MPLAYSNLGIKKRPPKAVKECVSELILSFGFCNIGANKSLNVSILIRYRIQLFNYVLFGTMYQSNGYRWGFPFVIYLLRGQFPIWHLNQLLLYWIARERLTSQVLVASPLRFKVERKAAAYLGGGYFFMYPKIPKITTASRFKSEITSKAVMRSPPLRGNNRAALLLHLI